MGNITTMKILEDNDVVDTLVFALCKKKVIHIMKRILKEKCIIIWPIKLSIFIITHISISIYSQKGTY